MKNISIFKDKEDINKKISDDEIINITGAVGSGKTTLGNLYRTKSEYVVISLDCFRVGYLENIDKETLEINNIIKSKYPEFDPKYYKEYYDMIIDYLKCKYIDKKIVIEGASIYFDLEPKDLKGTLIIKRTSILKCYIRALRRDIGEKIRKLKEKEISKSEYIQGVLWLLKRRTHQLRHYNKLNEFIEKVYERHF